MGGSIAIDRTEGRGRATDGALVWTGSTAKGLKSPAASAQCLDWKTRDAATGARTGAVGIRECGRTQQQSVQQDRAPRLLQLAP